MQGLGVLNTVLGEKLGLWTLTAEGQVAPVVQPRPNQPTLADPRLTHLRGTGFGNYSGIPLRPRNGQKRTATATQKPGLTPRGPFVRQDPPSPPGSASPDFWKGREGPTKASDTLTKESVRWSFGGDLGRGCRRQGSGNARRATETSPRAAI